MATNLELGDSLIDEAVEVGNHTSKKEAVTSTLQDFEESRRRPGILEWMGRVEYFEDYDHKKLRGGDECR